MRTYIHSRLTDVANTDLHALVPAASIRASGGASDDTGLARPFITVRSRVQARPFRERPVDDGGVTVHIHDDPDSYLKIDQIMKEVRKIMDASGARWYGTIWVTAVDEQDWSEDLFDDHYGTATRFGTYRVVAGN
jgi:hypothetical protein